MTAPIAAEPGVAKIAVLRANGVGDYVLAVPALEALRVTYPDAELVYIGRQWHADFLRDRPGPVDRVEVCPVRYGVHWEPGMVEDRGVTQRFLAAMRGEGFDLAVQLHGGGRYSNPFVRAFGARLTLGLQAADAPPLDRNVPYIYWQHEVHRYIEVAGLVGARPPALEPRIAVTDRDLDESCEAVDDTLTDPLVILHPGATDARRRWPPASFAAVGDALAALGARVVVTGSPLEREVVEEVVGAMQSQVQACCVLSLGGLAGLLSRADVVVSNDSGPLHLAGAVGAATVGIYWCGILPAAGPLTLTRHRPLVAWRLSCPECGRSTGLGSDCEHRSSWVSEIGAYDVTLQAFDLLGVDGSLQLDG